MLYMRRSESTNVVAGVVILGITILGFLGWWRFFAEDPCSFATIIKYANLKILEKKELGDGSSFQLLAIDTANQTAKFKTWQGDEIREIVIKKQEQIIRGFGLADIQERKVQICYATAGPVRGRPFMELFKRNYP